MSKVLGFSNRTVARLWLGASAFVLVAAGSFAMWILSLPSSTSPIAPEPVPESETRESLSALRPRKRERPLIAVIGINDATETTDFLMPAGILRRADVAEVITVATNPGAVNLYPALKVQPDATVAEFDEKYGDGADYVIVPAMSRDDDPTALSWIKSQAAKGAIVIGVCAGAKVVGAAGLLDDKHATTHWYYLRELRRNNPKAVYVPNRRFVVDRNVVTTTGITASIPMSLTLIEAIAGRQRAQAVAQDLGVTHWDASHASGAFRLTRPFVLTVLENGFTFWNREGLEIELSPDIDEVSLVLVADAWSRTYRSRVVTFADTTAAVETRNGFRIIPDQVSSSQPTNRLPQDIGTQKPAEVLKEALAAIRDRYGERTSGIVAMQLEYPQQDAR